MRHGKGRFKWADGDVYDGYFKHDLKDGTGTYRYSNND